MSYNPSAPNHRFDTSTGWRVFAEAPDTETIYGNYRFKWTVIPAPEPGYYARIRVHLSLDDGQTWMEESSIWSLYSVNHKQIGNYHDTNSELNQALIAAREEWKVARRRRLDRERREEFNALPPEQRALIKTARSEAWKLRKEKAEERRMERTAKIMEQMLHFGPDLVRLKEDIEGLLAVMAKGGMDRPLAHYYSRRRWINGAKWYINGYRRDIELAQKRTAGKR